jgi:hypothetical protein
MRETTRAGRKIRHVAPGHVVDVATGIDIERSSYFVRGGAKDRWTLPGQRGRLLMLDESLRHVARAEAVCVLVRVMLAIGGCL